ncbi:MAG: 2-oxoacid:acceptor oxidoreductase family protein [Oscillospiraceae bacterium]|nr:2-oxoacid:acceptor oxidoreductase family protein [Oscillospiraceae bacterium]
MIEILWLGRGGQGAFTAAKLLGAAFVEQKQNAYALAFPSFGPERRGAPVRAFTKLDENPVSDRSETEQADYIILLDETLYVPTLRQKLKANGKILLNSKHTVSDTVTFDGTEIAKQFRLPTVNTIMLGVLAGYSSIISPDAVKASIEHYLPEKIREKNIQAVLHTIQEVLK